LYSTGATVENVKIAGTLQDLVVSLPVEAVVWAQAVGVDPVGNSLTKTASNAWGNAGASSNRQITGGTGYAEFTVGTGYAMFGLGNGDVNQGFGDIEFAFYPYPDTGKLMVYEGGAFRGQFGSYSPGDVLQIRVESGVVRYLRNGVPLYTSSATATYPLRVDTALYSTGTTVQNVSIAGSLESVP
jgi:hypothetical protein